MAHQNGEVPVLMIKSPYDRSSATIRSMSDLVLGFLAIIGLVHVIISLIGRSNVEKAVDSVKKSISKLNIEAQGGSQEDSCPAKTSGSFVSSTTSKQDLGNTSAKLEDCSSVTRVPTTSAFLDIDVGDEEDLSFGIGIGITRRNNYSGPRYPSLNATHVSDPGRNIYAYYGLRKSEVDPFGQSGNSGSPALGWIRGNDQPQGKPLTFGFPDATTSSPSHFDGVFRSDSYKWVSHAIPRSYRAQGSNQFPNYELLMNG